MSLLDQFARVSRSRRCPVCEHADWCMISRDEPPSRAICARVESPRRWRDAGWLHRLRDDPRSTISPRRRARTASVPVGAGAAEFAALAARYRSALHPGAVAALAEELGVCAGSLERLGIGWTDRCWSFPMSDAVGSVRGIRLRCPDGTKLAVKGGREGLFLPAGLTGAGPLLICEGPTDTAAMLGLGFDAVGRPSCAGGAALAADLVRRRRPVRVVVVADADLPGTRGAAVLAAVLAPLCRDVRTVVPPEEDAREWIRSGAARGDVLDLIAAATPARVRVTTGRVKP